MSHKSQALRPAVFFDRDGTLNATHKNATGTPLPPARLDDFILLPGAAEACATLHRHGFVIVVATNQPDVGRGTQTSAAVEAIHARLRELVPEIAHIEVSYDAFDSPSARRRKPAPGMLLDAAAALGLDLGRSWMVGDRWRDIECGHRAGTRTILIGDGHGENFPVPPDHLAASATEVAALILAFPSQPKIPTS